MKLEEYISMRKKEDRINEYDVDKRTANTRICVNYVFEYFDNYLDTRSVDKLTVLHEQKVEKYRHMIREYNEDVQEWLTSFYISHGKHIHKHLRDLVVGNYFLLYNSEAEFRALSYEVYPIAVKKLPFLEGQSEAIFAFIKDTHRIRSNPASYRQDVFISEEIDEWIDTTYRKFGVNIYNFCREWVDYFMDHPDIWPKGHKSKSKYYDEDSGTKNFNAHNSLYWNYDYKQKSNLFGLDALYRNMPKKSFTKGRKQEFEAVLLYYWLHGPTSDSAYWNTYVETVL